MQPPQPGDVISADPRPVSSWAAWLVVVALLAAALTGTVITAVHYREVAAALRRVRPARALATPSIAPPVLSSDITALPSLGALTGELTVFVVRSSAGLAQVIVTARISGGRAVRGRLCKQYRRPLLGCRGHQRARISGPDWSGLESFSER